MNYLSPWQKSKEQEYEEMKKNFIREFSEGKVRAINESFEEVLDAEFEKFQKETSNEEKPGNFGNNVNGVTDLDFTDDEDEIMSGDNESLDFPEGPHQSYNKM